MQFISKINGEEIVEDELIRFNKKTIYSEHRPEYLKIINEINEYFLDLIKGELKFNNEVIHRIDKNILNIIRPIIFHRKTYDSNKVYEYLFYGLGYQYTLQGVNRKCFIVLNSDDKSFEVVYE
jgi:hypothetical protein